MLNVDGSEGFLFAIEGIDGAGKSTQAQMLVEALKAVVLPKVFLTKWNSSPVVEHAAKKAKRHRLLTPHTFALLEAADLADRQQRIIEPELRAGNIVVADRWVYTAFARGGARGLQASWLRGMYSFAIKPDICFYLKVPVEVALDRILKERQLKHYEAGMDTGLHEDPAASFREFQGSGCGIYNGLQMLDPWAVVIDGELPVEDQHLLIRHLVMEKLEAASGTSA